MELQCLCATKQTQFSSRIDKKNQPKRQKTVKTKTEMETNIKETVNYKFFDLENKLTENETKNRKKCQFWVSNHRMPKKRACK